MSSLETLPTPDRLLIKISIIGYPIIFFIAMLWISIRDGFTNIWFTSLDDMKWSLLLGLVCGGGVVLVSAFLSYLLPSVRKMEIELKQLVGDNSVKDCFLLAFMSGVAEEFLFRGAIQPWLGLVITSIIFGALHPPLKYFKLYPVFAALLGLFLGFLFEKTQSLITPAAAHFGINFGNLLRFRRISDLSQEY